MSEPKKTAETKETEFHGLEKELVFPSGMGVAGGPGIVIITFYFSPPEAENRSYVLSRTALTTGTAITLSKALRDAVDELTKASKNPQSE